MIPKRVCYTWISDKPVPERYRNYMRSWVAKMPGYEFVHLSLETVKRTPFVSKAIRLKNYALAGHYARVLDLYENGGIYFDIDIEVVKDPAPLLGKALVLGMEDQWVVNNAVIMAEPRHPFLKECLEFMDRFDFTKGDIELETGPRMFTTIAKRYGWMQGRPGSYRDGVEILPPAYFYPYRYDEAFTQQCIKPETVTLHHWGNSWNDRVSIVIPCYNQGIYLSDAIDSALAQTYKNIEVIVVNDGSVDNTALVARAYGSRIKYIEQKNRGLSGARNAGIKASSGGWILPLDADDKLHRDYIQKTIGRSDIVCPTLVTFGDYTERWRPPLERPTYADLIKRNQMFCCSIFKKEVWTQSGGYDEAMRDGYEDWEFWIRAAKCGFKILTTKDEMFFYRKHGKSMIDHAKQKHQSNISYIYTKHQIKPEIWESKKGTRSR